MSLFTGSVRLHVATALTMLLYCGAGSAAEPPPGAQRDKARAEAAKAIQRLNAIRVNPGRFAQLHASLADNDVEPRKPLAVSKALTAAAERKAVWMAENEREDMSHFAHVITINGEKHGMNGWMREAGYKLAPYLKDEDTNFECLFWDGGRGEAGVGQRAIDSFMSEGKDGGHVLPTLGRSFWANCKDIGVGVATSASGSTYVSVLVGVFNPFDPEATGGEPEPESPADAPSEGDSPADVQAADGRPQALVSLLPQEKALFDLINSERRKIKAKPLVYSTKLYSATSKHVAAMLEAGDFVSVLKDGKTADDRAKAEGYRAPVTEFLTAFFSKDTETAEGLWQAYTTEPDHRKLLDPQLTEIGISAYSNPQGGVAWVILFGSSRDAANPPRIEVFQPEE